MNLTFENFEKNYKSKKIFDNQNISINLSDVNCLCGESGSGKTTMFNILLKNDMDYSGEVYFSPSENLKIALMPQSHCLLPNYTVVENILSFSISLDFDLVDSILNQLGIMEYKNTIVKELSGGQKQRVNLARALINQPDIILLDEPTSNLDDVTTKEVLELIDNLSKSNITFLIITHDERVKSKFPNLIEIVDRKITINTGPLIQYLADTSKSKLLKPEIPMSYFLKASFKNNSKNILTTTILNMFLYIIIGVIMLFSLNNNYQFLSILTDFYGVNGGIVKSTYINEPNIECGKLFEFETCGNNEFTIPGFHFFTEEELDYLKDYDGFEATATSPGIPGNLHSSYSGETLYVISDRVDAYVEETGDSTIRENGIFNDQTLFADPLILQNFGSMTDVYDIFNVMYGEVRNIDVNEIIISDDVAKVFAHELKIPVEEIVGKEIIMDSESGAQVPYNVAWVYDSSKSEFDTLYTGYMGSNSIFKTGIFADSTHSINREGISDLERQRNFDSLKGPFEENYKNMSNEDSNYDYATALLKDYESIETLNSSYYTGDYLFFYKLKEGYTHEDLSSYIDKGPEMLGYRAVENKQKLLEYETYNDNDERILKMSVGIIIVFIVVFLFQSTLFKIIDCEVRLAKLMGVSYKEISIFLKRYMLKIYLISNFVAVTAVMVIAVVLSYSSVGLLFKLKDIVMLLMILIVFEVFMYFVYLYKIHKIDVRKELHG